MAWEKRKSKYEELFDEGARINAFNEMARLVYDGNFGKLSKTDFETLMFNFYIEQCLEKKVPFDDYSLSKDLGITQSRVRSLKVKKELEYPHKGFEWKKAFVGYISNARYDSTKHLVKMQIPDTNVLLELRNHIEKNGWYDEYQLNPKLFQCRADVFVDLCRGLDAEKTIELDDATKKKLKELKREAKSEKEETAIEKILSGCAEDGLKELALAATKELLQEALRLVPFGGIAGKAIRIFAEIVEKS